MTGEIQDSEASENTLGLPGTIFFILIIILMLGAWSEIFQEIWHYHATPADKKVVVFCPESTIKGSLGESFHVPAARKVVFARSVNRHGFFADMINPHFKTASLARGIRNCSLERK